MDINLTDLECKRLAEDTFKCVAEQPGTPVWFYPVVIACFVIALTILVLVARMTFKSRTWRERRVRDVPVAVDRRCAES